MPAFTYQCERVRITIAHQVITLYPTSESNRLDIYNLLEKNIRTAVKTISHRGKTYTFIHKFDPEHKHYHDDNKSSFFPHSHLHFPFQLTEDKIASILKLFSCYKIITEKEHDAFLEAYLHAVQNSKLIMELALLEIRFKQKKLKEKAQTDPELYNLPYSTANRLYSELYDAFKLYNSDNSPQHFLELKNRCEKEIMIARETLRNYQGWKPASTSLSFFKPNNKLDALDEAQKQLLRITKLS